MRYRVLKEFIGQSGLRFDPGTIITKDEPMGNDEAAFYEGLLHNGFIEEE